MGEKRHGIVLFEGRNAENRRFCKTQYVAYRIYRPHILNFIA